MALTSPNVGNYTLGKGKVYFSPDGESPPVWRDMGNVAEVEFSPEIEKLDHYSSREGIKSKDKSVPLEVSATLRLLMDEWTPDNLALAVLGVVSDVTSPGGKKQITILSETSIKGSVKFTGTNDVGPKYEYIWSSVEFTPSGSLNLIADEWGQIEVEGACLIVGTDFGTITEL